MSHHTATTALLLASLPYGLALPQFIPLVSELAPAVTPLTFPLAPSVKASSVTVIGTVVESAVEPAIEDAAETTTSALDDATDFLSDDLPTDLPSLLDPEANILPLILPGILPVLDSILDDLPDTNSLEVIDLPPPSEVPYGDDALIADPTPLPSEIPYGDDGLIADPITPDFPEEKTVPISTFNAVVQPLISVIQTLLNALPGNYAPPLPGIFRHPLLPTETPEIFIDPILPTETSDVLPTGTPDIFFDPLIDPIPTHASSIAADLPFRKRQEPTESSTNSILALIGPILEAISALIDQIPVVGPTVADVVSDIAEAVPDLSDGPVDVPIIPTDVPALSLDVPELPTEVPDVIALPTVPSDVVLTDDLPIGIPELPVSELPLPTLPADVPVPAVDPIDPASGIPDEVLNVPVPDDLDIDWSQFESPPFSDLPAPSLDDIPIPDDILNIPVPDLDENGVPIDAPVEPVADVPASVPVVALPTSLDALGDLPIPDDILNIPVPELDENGVPTDAPLGAVGDLPVFIPGLPLPTSLNALGDLLIPDDILNIPVPDLDENGIPIDAPLDAVSDLPTIPGQLPGLLDWPFDNWQIPDTLAPSPDGELPDLSDFGIPDDVLNVPVPDVDDLGVPLDLPTELSAPAFALPTDLGAVLPTDLSEIPVPEGFEDLGDLPTATEVVTGLPALPTLDDVAIPDDVLNIPVPDLDENGFPIELPTDAASGILLPDAPVTFPTNLFDVPVPEGFEDLGDLPDLPAPALPTDIVPVVTDLPLPDDVLNIPVPDLDENGLPIDLPSEAPAPALPTAAFGDGFPIQALPDVPLVLPALPSDEAVELPTEALLPAEGLPTLALTNVLAAVPVGTSAPALPVPEPAAPTLQGIVASVVAVSADPAILVDPVVPTFQGVVPSVVAAPTNPTPAVIAPRPLTFPKLPFQVPPVARSLAKREMAAQAAPLAASATDPSPTNIALSLIKPLLSLVSSLLAKLPVVGTIVPDLGANLPNALLPAVSGLDGLVSSLPALPGLGGALPAVPGLPNLGNAVPNVGSIFPTVPGLGGLLTPPLSLPSLPGLPGLDSILPGLVFPSVSPAAPAVPDVAALLASLGNGLPATPAVASAVPVILPAVASILPKVGSALLVTPAAAGTAPTVLPVVAGLTAPSKLVPRQLDAATGPVSAVPGISETLSSSVGVVSKVPVAFGSSLTKAAPTATSALDTAQIVTLVKTLTNLISSLLQTVKPVVSNAPVKRQALGIDPASISAALQPLNSNVNIQAILNIIQPLLRVIGQLVAGVPVNSLQQLGLVNGLGKLGKRQLNTATGASPVDQVVLTLLAPLLNLIRGLIAAIPLPQPNALAALTGGQSNPLAALTSGQSNPLAALVAAQPNLLATLNGAAAPLTGVVSDLTKALPINLPIARRAVEEFQQGPASDWETFLHELDESKQDELSGFVHDSAKAVNNDELDTLAQTLKADFEELSEATKARLVSGWAPGPVLSTTLDKRTMRHGKRQTGIPGALSIGPDLDNAPKIELSSILGAAGTLDPLQQLNQGSAEQHAGHFVDDFTEDYLLPSQAVGSFNQLADSSVNTGISPELSAILGAAGTLDPNNMLDPSIGSPVDDDVEDPYAGNSPPDWNAALDGPQALDGLEATLQASKNNHIGLKKPDLPFARPQQGGSAAAQQAAAQQQGEVLRWFQRFVKPSGRSDVDAQIVR